MFLAESVDAACPVKLGKQDRDTGTGACYGKQEQVHHSPRYTDCCKILLSGKVSDHGGINRIVELLEDIAHDQGQHQSDHLQCERMVILCLCCKCSVCLRCK